MKYITPKLAAKLIGVDPPAIYKAMARGHFGRKENIANGAIEVMIPVEDDPETKGFLRYVLKRKKKHHEGFQKMENAEQRLRSYLNEGSK